MQKRALILFIILLSYHFSFGQDYRILQKDKGKIYITTTRTSDSVLQVVIVNADWRMDYVQKSPAGPVEMSESGEPVDPQIHKSWHPAAISEAHHGRQQMTRSFYVDASNITSVNGIFNRINNEYRAIMQISDNSYELISYFLPDTADDYHVEGYKGASTASLELMYLWGAPFRNWTVGCAISIHDREARKVLSSIVCMGPNDTDLKVKKIRIRQDHLLAIMSYKDMFCP